MKIGSVAMVPPMRWAQTSSNKYQLLFKNAICSHWDFAINITTCIEIEKVDVFRKELNKQFIGKFKAIFILSKTLLHTDAVCFTLWRDDQWDLIQIESSI